MLMIATTPSWNSKIFINSGDASQDAPKTHTTYANFKSRSIYLSKLNPKMYLRKPYRDVFSDHTEP